MGCEWDLSVQIFDLLLISVLAYETIGALPSILQA
jgi:hypothetical protein